MIVIDSSALIAILLNEAEAETFALAIAKADRIFLSSLGMIEIGMVAIGRRGPEGLGEIRRLVTSHGIETVALTPDLADLALDAFARFGKGRHPAGLNMGDCASYALAASRRLPLLYKGSDFSRTDITSVL